jgi:hypothetical protein
MTRRKPDKERQSPTIYTPLDDRMTASLGSKGASADSFCGFLRVGDIPDMPELDDPRSERQGLLEGSRR